MASPHFFVVSIGNPLPAYSTLHSAGHFANRGLAQIFRQPEWRERRLGKAKTCLVSQGPKYTLVQSPTLMNTSGSFVLAAWNEMCEKHNPKSLSLIVLHDELEKKLGEVALLSWTRSPRGHNGIKDVLKRVQKAHYPNSMFARIAIGIGRPSERDQDTVVKYVMNPLSPETRGLLEDVVPFEVARTLARHEVSWKLAKKDDPE